MSEEAGQAGREIQVQGHGEVQAAPDVALINLGVLARERDARAAMRTVSEQMRAIIDAIHAQGIPDHDVQTAQLNLYFDHETNSYTASHSVTARVRDVGGAGAVLDAAVDVGANASAGVQFALADQSEAEDRALELAVEDARHKADTLATALGVTVEDVQRVIVTHGGVAYDTSARVLRSIVAPRAPAPIEAGQLRITADVQVTYSFR